MHPASFFLYGVLVRALRADYGQADFESGNVHSSSRVAVASPAFAFPLSRPS